MCGIVGLFSKSPGMGAQLGRHLGAMVAQMAERFVVSHLAEHDVQLETLLGGSSPAS